MVMNADTNWDFLLKQFEDKALKQNISKDILKLLVFTSLKQPMLYFENTFHYKMQKENNGYIFHTGKKDYYFELLSDKKILDYDKKNLKNIRKRNAKSLLRTLRIATSNHLLDQKLLLIASKGFSLNAVVEYKKDNDFFIIDYANNLIMKKNDYFDLFQSAIINVLDKETLYRIHENYDYLYDIDLFYFLFAGQEIMKDINKSFLKEEPFFTTINPLSEKIIGDDSDGIFLDLEDKKENAMDEEIDLSTLKNNSEKLSHIKELANGNLCYQKTFLSKKVEYKALSDFIENKEIAEELTSEDRYSKCHFNSLVVFLNLDITDYDEAYVVSGKISLNDIEYIYHTWLELKKNGKWFVIDYNRNIVMSKDDYYQMKNPIVISKNTKEVILKLLKYEKDFQINLYSSLKTYFAEEILRDLEKNKSLIKK